MGNVSDSGRQSIRSSFITQHPPTLAMLQMAERVAHATVSVLIQGESGTGKEVVAKLIHEKSARARRSLVSVNCGAIQETLLLSELFGHEKGAFTGAVTQKKGLVEIADGGTLFLDEIGEMGMEAQTKLLRFLQEGEVFRVGGGAPLHVDVRVISATNKDLDLQVRNGKFREDLFYRINTVMLRIPPLRNRPDDIPLFIEKFLNSDRAPFQLPSRTITSKAIEILKQYSWPGNVRELQNIVERFKILSDTEVIGEGDIPGNLKTLHGDLAPLDPKSGFLLSQIEKQHILKVLQYFLGNKTKAASAMGITVKTLYNKLATYERESLDVSSDLSV